MITLQGSSLSLVPLISVPLLEWECVPVPLCVDSVLDIYSGIQLRLCSET